MKENETPEGAIIPAPRALPKLGAVTSLADVAGENIKAHNLRDHPEYDGQILVIADVKFNSGETGPYAVFNAYRLPPGSKTVTEENHVIIMTGSENVVERLARVLAANGFPVKAQLRKAGRAWFLD